MTKISATILTYNEVGSIEGCLESLRDIADEIIVVDSGSTDSTLDICRRYGCKISQRELAGFGAQRQYATSLTTHSYVLAIDADEELSPALRRSLIELKTQGLTHRVYAFSRLNFYCGFAVRHLEPPRRGRTRHIPRLRKAQSHRRRHPPLPLPHTE